MSDSKSEDIRELHLRKDDFLGAFAVIEREDKILMVQNRRVIRGEARLTWDLPGGQVEPGETLMEALARELQEEVQIEVEGDCPFLFFQEGTRSDHGQRLYLWRSFFFRVTCFQGEPQASAEVLDSEWVPICDLPQRLDAPYHDSFRHWLKDGGNRFESIWAE